MKQFNSHYGGREAKGATLELLRGEGAGLTQAAAAATAAANLSGTNGTHRRPDNDG